MTRWLTGTLSPAAWASCARACRIQGRVRDLQRVIDATLAVVQVDRRVWRWNKDGSLRWLLVADTPPGCWRPPGVSLGRDPAWPRMRRDGGGVVELETDGAKANEVRATSRGLIAGPRDTRNGRRARSRPRGCG
jgi:hypothetical protein